MPRTIEKEAEKQGMPILSARIPKEDAEAFLRLAERLGLAPGTLLRFIVQFALRVSRELQDDEQFLYLLLEEGAGGEEDADQI